MRIIIQLLCLGCLFLTTSTQARLNISDEAMQPLHGAVQFLEDTSGNLTIEDILQQQTWQQNNDSAFNKGYNTSTWWLKLQIHNPQQHQLQRIIEIGYALLDHIHVHIVHDRKLQDNFVLGDLYPFHQRKIDSQLFAFPVHWKAQQSLTVYLQVRSQGAVQVPLKLWRQDAHQRHQNRIDLAQGIYLGGMVIIGLYNAFLFIVLRDRTYLLYVAMIFSMLMLFSSVSGQAFRYIWPEAAGMNEIMIVTCISAATTFSVLFARAFLHINKIMPPLDKFLRSTLPFMVALPFIQFFFSYYIMIQLSIFGIIIFMTAVISASIYCIYRGNTSAKIFLAAWFVFIIGTFTLTLNKLNLVPTNFFTENAAPFGNMIEVVLLSLALANRINNERKLRYEAQKQLLTASEKMKVDLEIKVKERTAELEDLNKKLEHLSQTDQLTGIFNRRYLEQRLREEFSRCARYKHAISVLMIDIDHFKSVNDQYGHGAGDDCLKTVAKHLLSGVRWPADICARYGGEEFCLVLPETNSRGAVTVAERIRESVRGSVISYDNKVFSVSMSVGVYTQTDGEYDHETALKRADNALYQAKEAGRDRVIAFQGDNR